MENQVNTHISMNVKGMTCTNCALGIEKLLEKEGMERISVSFSDGEVQFDTNNSQTLSKIVKGIERLGFEVVKDKKEETGLSKVEKYFFFCLIFTLPLLAHMFLPFHFLHNPWFQLIMATPVFVVGLMYFGKSALGSIKAGIPNMDVLITIGASAAFFYSLYGTLNNLGPDFLFYETAASIITLVLLGNVMEHRSVQKTTSAVKSLVQLQPKTAQKINYENGNEVIEQVNIDKIKKGDVLQVNTGDQIPVDGIVVFGEGDVNESMITGESMPVLKTNDALLIGGSILVNGNLHVKATEVGKQMVLSKIIDMVKQAQADKPNIQQLADKISAIFVPAVILIALLTFVISFWVVNLSLQAAIIHSVAVLVIACPCAMGLATPTAVVVGIGRASKMGLLIKGGRTLEAFSTIKQMVFDKTGTLTTGDFTIEKIHGKIDELPAITSILHSLEKHASHPIAQSICKGLSEVPLTKLDSVKEVKGIGMVGSDTDGNQYQLGSYRMAEGLTSEKQHSLYLVKNGALWATVDLKDEIRPGVKELITFLKNKNIEPILVSGDRSEKCHQLAESVGIEKVYAEQLPQEKLALIESFSAEKPTAMVGDGINDAPALARATVGISLSQASDVAVQSAQVILLNGKIGLLKDLFLISKHTVKTIKENLFWAFFYNVLAIPLAAFGFLKPIIAAATMAFSDVIVIGNSLRLKIKKLN